MNKLIKHKWEDRDKIFVSSDWHNFHDPKWSIPIWKMRGYESPRQSADDVIEKINSKVGVDDYLYYLGDGFLNATDEQCLEWFSKINCQNIYYISGNHESNMQRIYRNEVVCQYGILGADVYPLRLKNIIFLGYYQEIQIGKYPITLTHFPMHGWNRNSHGAINLHGHCHNNDESRNPKYHMGKCLDCSWDYKKDVWKISEIFDIMDTKEMYITDHHNKD